MSDLDVRRWTADDYRAARQSVLGSALPPTSRLLLLVLIEHMPLCSPSIERLMAQTGASRSTVIRTLAQLETGGVLRVERAHGRRSVYQLTPAEGWPVTAPANDTSVTMTPDQCHHDTGSAVTPVSPRHPNQCHHDTGGVSPRHGGGVMVTPKAVFEAGSKADLEAEKSASAHDPPPPVTEARSIEATPVRRSARFVPDDWQPNETHAVRCQELRFELSDLVARFRRHEFNREYSDWPRRFSAWIEDERIRQQTANARASPRRYGSAQKDDGVDVMSFFKGVRG